MLQMFSYKMGNFYKTKFWKKKYSLLVIKEILKIKYVLNGQLWENTHTHFLVVGPLRGGRI